MQFNKNSRTLVVEEPGFSTVCGIEAKHIYDYYRLRADVFRSELKWIGSPSDQIDIDPFDTQVVHFLTLSPKNKVIAALRLHPAQQKWMMEEHFPTLMPTNRKIHTEDACEISRLAIDSKWRNFRINRNIMVAEVLYKGVFQYCLANKIRYIYMVTTSDLVGHLNKKGLPINIIGKQKMPDGMVAFVAQLDWYVFIYENAKNNHTRIAWYLDLSATTRKRMAS